MSTKTMRKRVTDHVDTDLMDEVIRLHDSLAAFRGVLAAGIERETDPYILHILGVLADHMDRIVDPGAPRPSK